MVNGHPNSNANQRAKKRARKEEQAAQHEDAENSAGATASTAQAIEQLVVGVQEIDLHTVIENSPLAARVTQLDETLQDLTRGLNESRDGINETINEGINGLDERINAIKERLDVIHQDVTAAANVANATQAQFGENLGPFGDVVQRISVLELRQETHSLASFQAVSELRAGLHALRAEWAAIKQDMAKKAELEAAILELVEFRGLLNQISERLGRLEAINRENAQEQRPDVMTAIIDRLARLEAQEQHTDQIAEIDNRLELLEAQELPYDIAEINERLDHLEARNHGKDQERPDEMAEIQERIARLEAALLASDEEDV